MPAISALHVSDTEPIRDEPAIRARTHWRVRIVEMPPGTQLRVVGVRNQSVRTFCWTVGKRTGRTYRTRRNPWETDTTIVQRLT